MYVCDCIERLLNKSAHQVSQGHYMALQGVK